MPLPASNRFTPEYDLKTGVASLKINDSQPNDSGQYEVIAENPLGSDRTRANLNVNRLPSIDNTPIINPDAFKYLNPVPAQNAPPEDAHASKVSPPKVIIPLKDLNVSEGLPVNMMTKITGFPVPNIRWLHNGRPIIESSRYM